MALSFHKMSAVELLSAGLIFIIISGAFPLLISFWGNNSDSYFYPEFLFLKFIVMVVSVILFFAGLLLVLSAALSKIKK
ncbi:hypothetical protein MsAm2_03220 [Methanolapillus ohkumae]|uniref:DUF3955 domain-containing protein n=1 Tax=Methanolapillus ohkumae TaxID=3028298 RepID=A0AA96ZV77_9EURY|nr:hypothetical protein MsAm2_03220 [Methanosarcinaceae archaeon Am2]